MSAEGYGDPAAALGMCLITSEDYSREHGWGLVRVTGLTYPGREHWASLQVTADDLSDAVVRDATMRQFDPNVRPLWVGSLDDWLDDLTEVMRDHLSYECYARHDRGKPMYADRWIREDIEPGPLAFRPASITV